MKKSFLISAVLIMVIVSAGIVVANKANEGEGYSITISPSTLVLSSPGTVVTVHSNIPYSTVDTVTLTLDGIAATSTKADDCGDLVVKFNKEDVEDIVEPGTVVLTLSGQLTDGTPFSVSDSIVVKE